MIDLPSKKEKGPAPKPARKPEKEPKPLNRVSDKQRVRIKANKSYYKLVLETKPHVCENCGEKIINASGRNVSHILSGGSNPALYHDEENNYLLCDLCEHIWTNGDKTKMRIYPESEEISTRLKLKYYQPNK